VLVDEHGAAPKTANGSAMIRRFSAGGRGSSGQAATQRKLPAPPGAASGATCAPFPGGFAFQAFELYRIPSIWAIYVHPIVMFRVR